MDLSFRVSDWSLLSNNNSYSCWLNINFSDCL